MDTVETVSNKSRCAHLITPLCACGSDNDFCFDVCGSAAGRTDPLPLPIELRRPRDSWRHQRQRSAFERSATLVKTIHSYDKSSPGHYQAQSRPCTESSSGVLNHVHITSVTIRQHNSSMRYHHHAYLVAALALQVLAADPIDDTKHPHIPCTIRSPTSNAFFDLNKVFVTLPDEGKKITGESRNTSWPARGYDYGANFTLNFCGSVVEKLHDVVGVDEDQWRNVSAFYEMHGKTYSIG